MILPDQIHSKQSKDLIKKKVRTAFRAVKLRWKERKTRQTGSVDALKKQNKTNSRECRQKERRSMEFEIQRPSQGIYQKSINQRE